MQLESRCFGAFSLEANPTEPAYFNILSKVDQEKYKNLQKELMDFCFNRSKKNCKIQDMEECINRIKHYCIQYDPDDKKRCFVCGLIWQEYGVAVNLCHLQFLLKKCKSSLNTTLRAMGYELTDGRCDANSFFQSILPDVQLSKHEKRLWTFRTNSKTNDVETVKNILRTYRTYTRKPAKAPKSIYNIESSIILEEIPSNIEEEDPSSINEMKFEFEDFLEDSDSMFYQYFDQP